MAPRMKDNRASYPSRKNIENCRIHRADSVRKAHVRGN